MGRRRNPYLHDPNTRRAAQLGYPARSVFKLEEIDRRVSLLRPGQVVLDLGAAPGSWSRYAAARVAPAGSVVAVDLAALAEPLAPNVIAIVGDVFGPELDLGQWGPFDVVLSDMAPKTSGSKAVDQARSQQLFDRALALASELGKVGSSFVGKLFMSAAFEQARREVATAYGRCRVVRPAGTRPSSVEIFLVGLGRR